MHFQYSYAHLANLHNYYYFEGGTIVWEWTQGFSRVFTVNKVNPLLNEKALKCKPSSSPAFTRGLPIVAR